MRVYILAESPGSELSMKSQSTKSNTTTNRRAYIHEAQWRAAHITSQPPRLTATVSFAFNAYGEVDAAWLEHGAGPPVQSAREGRREAETSKTPIPGTNTHIEIRIHT